jgi:hypothetical protein
MKLLAIRLSPHAGKSLVIAVLTRTVIVVRSLPPCFTFALNRNWVWLTAQVTDVNLHLRRFEDQLAGA